MKNVVAFPTPHNGARRVVTVQWATIAFMPLQELEHTLAESQHWNDPLLFGSIIESVARWLADTSLTDAQARTHGWASATVARERADDMLRLLDEHASRCLAKRRGTLPT